MKVLNLDSSEPFSVRVEALLAQMTLEEKLGQMMQLAARDGDFDSYIERYHLGSYLHAVGDEVVRLQNLNQDRSRLKIPLIFGIDAIHGHCLEDQTTVFPVQLAMACTWNTDLIKQMGQVTANEARASNLHWTFSPVLCMGRDPRWGRTSETFGEDTLLVSTFAAALCEGYQTAEYPLAACAKHYAAYGEASGGRDSADVHVSERVLRNLLLPPFEHLAQSGCKTFMAGYQSLNGEPCSSNTWLMNDVLRKEWGYQGVVVTDWNNCGQMATLQNAAVDLKEAVFQCLQASNDVFMATPDFFDLAKELIAEGRIAESRIDESVRRILKLKFELGLFDDLKAPDRKTLLADKNRWDLALQAAQESVTLVKNTGVLPLSNATRRILLVGENADCLRNQLGDWSFIPGMAAYEDTTSHRADTVTLYRALVDYCKRDGIELVYLGADFVGPESEQSDYQHIQQQAAEADVILFCAGDALKQYGEFHDRADLNLPGNQNPAFEILQGSGKPLVSVLLMSKPHCVSRVLDKSDAALVVFNPGAKGGVAIADCLFGSFNPCGRLPISFPRHVGQLPVYYNQSPGWHARLSAHYGGQDAYVDLPPSPLLAFGEGISYSNIEYGEARLSCKHLSAPEKAVELSLSLTNNSDCDAIEIVQLYCQLWIPGVTGPAKQLLKFERVCVAAGESTQVVFHLICEDFIVLNRALKKWRYQGKVELMVGKSSKRADLQMLALTIV